MAYRLKGSDLINSLDERELDLKPIYSNNYDKYIIFKTQYQYLRLIKNKIAKTQSDVEENNDEFQVVINKNIVNKNSHIENWSDWNSVKKLTNSYELIHITSKNYNNSVAYYIPVSRSYFKMVEMLNQFNLFEKWSENSINIVCLAEGPGGFIEAIIKKRRKNLDRIFGMTLKRTNRNIPNWKRLFFALNKYSRSPEGLNPNIDKLW